MKIALVALPLVLALVAPVTADAKAPPSASVAVGKHKRVGVAIADAEPRTRIRGVQGPDGLTPLEFANWLNAHPRLATETPEIRRVWAPTRLLNRAAQHFTAADRNRDGRVSSDELADFVQPDPVTSLRAATPTT